MSAKRPIARGRKTKGLQHITYVNELSARLQSTEKNLRVGWKRITVTRGTCDRGTSEWRKIEVTLAV